ncbi:hypothetical protein HEB94_008988 [Actinopolymorpha pittospori]|uniref:Uncharacterized protein n=1 Tax=Actinopolymorpha pittospori TaxID=648752 RepID=A0A927N3S9_9ACTN|nr:hypothetical protein [Actinopolymorpha pittospori]
MRADLRKRPSMGLIVWRLLTAMCGQIAASPLPVSRRLVVARPIRPGTTSTGWRTGPGTAHRTRYAPTGAFDADGVGHRLAASSPRAGSFPRVPSILLAMQPRDPARVRSVAHARACSILAMETPPQRHHPWSGRLRRRTWQLGGFAGLAGGLAWSGRVGARSLSRLGGRRAACPQSPAVGPRSSGPGPSEVAKAAGPPRPPPGP